MIADVCKVLAQKIVPFSWIDKQAGLIEEAKRPIVVTNTTGVREIRGYESFPVSCDTAKECFERGTYTYLVPDSNKGGVSFFMDNGGAAQRGFGVKRRPIWSFNIRLLVWLNTSKLSLSGCNSADVFAAKLAAQFLGFHNNAILGGSPSVRGVEVTGVSILQKSPAVFQPFTFSGGDTRGIFLAPYDYFAIQLTGQFTSNHCAILPTVTTTTGECLDC